MPSIMLRTSDKVRGVLDLSFVTASDKVVEDQEDTEEEREGTEEGTEEDVDVAVSVSTISNVGQRGGCAGLGVSVTSLLPAVSISTV